MEPILRCFGNDDFEASSRAEETGSAHREAGEGESRGGVAGLRTECVGSEKRFFEKRRIAHNGIEVAGVAKRSAMIVVQKIGTKHVDLLSEGRPGHIFRSLFCGLWVDFERDEVGFRKTLGEQECDEPAARTDVQDAFCRAPVFNWRSARFAAGGLRWFVGRGQSGPCTEENAVCADFHGAAVVVDNELTEGKHREEDVVGERWEGGTCVLEGERRVSRGNAKEIERCSKRNRAIQQKKYYNVAKNSCHSAKKLNNAGKSGAFQDEITRFGEKVGRYRMKVPLFSHKVSDFSATLGREREQVGISKKQVAVIARKVGALVRRTGFPE